MTIAEFEDFLEATKHLTAVQRAEAYGIDISLIDANLRLTPTQKIRQIDIALNQVEDLQSALAQTRARSGIDSLPTC
jgi:sulfite reductase beta subunit-like hemoprotein